MSTTYSLWGLDGRAPVHVGAFPALTVARGCWRALGTAAIVADGRVVDTRGNVELAARQRVRRAERDRLAALPLAAEPPPVEVVMGRPETSPDVPDMEVDMEVEAIVAADVPEAPETPTDVPALIDGGEASAPTPAPAETSPDVPERLGDGARHEARRCAEPARRAPRPRRSPAPAAAFDPFAELRAVGERLATHRALLDAADALTPADRAMVTALAERLAGGRSR